MKKLDFYSVCLVATNVFIVHIAFSLVNVQSTWFNAVVRFLLEVWVFIYASINEKINKDN